VSVLADAKPFAISARWLAGRACRPFGSLQVNWNASELELSEANG